MYKILFALKHFSHAYNHDDDDVDGDDNKNFLLLLLLKFQVSEIEEREINDKDEFLPPLCADIEHKKWRIANQINK